MPAARPGEKIRSFLTAGFRTFPSGSKPSKAIALAAFLMSVSSVHAAPAGSPGMCAPGAGISAVDTATPVNAKFLAGLKSIGIGTVIRYYDWEQESIRGKTLTAAEVKLIGQAQMQVAVVFQHHNDQIQTFMDPTRGTVDARRSLDLAQQLGQPKGGTVYFGVDGDFPMNLVGPYFQQINAVLKPAGYKVGVYGSGRVGKALLSSGLAEKFWLANAKGWSEYASVADGKAWSIKQDRTINASGCFGISVDPNYVQPGRENDFGAWAPGQPQRQREPLVASQSEPRVVSQVEARATARPVPATASERAIARPDENPAIAFAASRERSEKSERLEYETTMILAGIKSPPWSTLTEDQREDFRKELRAHRERLQDFAAGLQPVAMKP